MIPLGASSCACKTILRSTEQWRIFVKTWFLTFVLESSQKLLFYNLHVALCHKTHQELIKRQGNRSKRNYIELAPGSTVWVQHRQNATWEPATVVNQCGPNSYWIMQENGTEQPKVYRHTRTMLKIRSTPTEGKRTAQMKE